MRRCIAIIVVFAAWAQDEGPSGVLRGSLVSIGDGRLALKMQTDAVYGCGYDSHTYIERDGQRVFSGALRKEDPVEIIADRKAGKCYARTVRIMSQSVRRMTFRPYRSTLEHIFPRGNLTFAGVVRRLNDQMLVLRTRTTPEQVVLLRDDTRYLEGGHPVDASHLAVNSRVFIRGGRNLENDLEAYQVIWGQIPGPKRER